MEKPFEEKITEICREWAYVEFRETPYDSRLDSLKAKIEETYKDSFVVYGEDKKRLAEISDELESFAQDRKRLFNLGGIKKLFNGKRNLEEISEFGDSLVRSRDKLSEFKGVIDKAYNRNSKAIFDISSCLREAEETIERYEGECGRLEKAIAINIGVVQASEKHVAEIVEKEVQEGRLKFSNESEKEAYIQAVIRKGRLEFKKLCEDYLKAKNDIPIAKNLLSYKNVLENYNSACNSFVSIRDKIVEDISQIEDIIRLYEVITKRELNFMQEIKIPEKYADAIRDLVIEIERADSEFSQRVLKLVFSQKLKIDKPNSDNVVSGLIEHVNGNGKNSV